MRVTGDTTPGWGKGRATEANRAMSRRRRSRAQYLAWRAAAILAVTAAVVTGALTALSTVPREEALAARLRHRLRRHHRRVIVAPDGGGNVEPIAEVITNDENDTPWPPPLLNPDAKLRWAWDLSLGRPGSHEVLFSFDDGPNPGTTDRLLRILKNANIHAVFFVCGWRMEAEEPLKSRTRQILRDIVAQGHVVGNHTVHHRVLPQLTTQQMRYEIDHNADLIEEVIGERPHLFRPPYGAYSEDVRRHVVSLHNELWLWSIDPHDYLVVNDPETVAQRVILNIANHAGGTVLLHDTHPWSVTAVPKILRWIEETNRERAIEGRAPYEILDAARYLAGARERIPLIRAALHEEAPQTADAGATDAGAADASQRDASAPEDGNGDVAPVMAAPPEPLSEDAGR